MRIVCPIASPSSAPNKAALNDSSSSQPSTSPINMNIHCMVDIPKQPQDGASPAIASV
jgi:hypothetical protein